ncbi:hypothetical protein ACJJI3_18810 [Microbulbifer sp. ZKSA004]|uniref:hypothetical protein n=1 Tax=Microbulbifer sp. ZKSA004 TaxID=3243389 RepID=UPI00403A409A
MKNVLIFLLVLILPKMGMACSCSNIEVEDYLSSCDSLFIARLVKAEYKESDESGGEIKGKFGAPIEVFQGDPSKVKGLKIEHMIGSSCDQYPTIGSKYLVCGKNEKKYTSYSHCSYTVDHAEHYRRDILKQLRDKNL